MRVIRDVLERKALQQLITIGPDASSAEAARLMAVWNVGALIVIDEAQVVGLVSERDFVRALAAGVPPETKVGTLMQRDVKGVPADLSPNDCMALMTQLRLRHVTVLEGDAVLGIVSLGDLVKDVVSEQAYVIEQLELYIARAANA